MNLKQNKNSNKKRIEVTILLSDKIDFKSKKFTRDKERLYILIKGSIQQDITIINIYAPNKIYMKYIHVRKLYRIEGRNKKFSNKSWRCWDFPGGSTVKNPPSSAGDKGSIPGPGRSHMLWSN